MTTRTTHWADRLRAALPTREVLATHPWLKPVAGSLLDPRLWRIQHEAVARGVAVGVFWAFAIPFAQVVVATVHCTRWRANIPVAAAVTMLTNPLTIGFWLWLAYQSGASVLGEPLTATTQMDVGAMVLLAQFGWPTIVGMGMFAFGGAATGYLGVKLLWRLRIWIKRRGRRPGRPGVGK